MQVQVRTTFYAKNNNNPNWEGRSYKRTGESAGKGFLVFGFGQGGQICTGTGLWKGLKRRVIERREKGVET
jgi:hypothetical protein